MAREKKRVMGELVAYQIVKIEMMMGTLKGIPDVDGVNPYAERAPLTQEQIETLRWQKQQAIAASARAALAAKGGG